jgi:hypothetical protein
MGTIRFAIGVFVALFALISASNADVIKNFRASSSENGSIIIQWSSADESNVASYEIQRAVPNGTFQTIGVQDPRGSATAYEFTDNTAFMKATTVYQYRIQIIAISGNNPLPTQPITVSHSVSGVRRTWGSIKAMFR